MRQDLIRFIQELSAKDKKNLSEKGFKMMEELGELAKVVLPYMACHGTRHRFVTRDRILEELADINLVLMSMVYDVGYTEEDLWGMMKLKSEKWAKLQADDEKVKDRIPFEIHITVKAPVETELFKHVCNDLQVKPILLTLQTRSEKCLTDVMTSSVFYGSNAGVMNEVERIVNGLIEAGFTVLRKKVETVPWHPAAPTRENGYSMPVGCYFECHFNVLVENTAQRDVLHRLALEESMHVSRNMFKEYEDGTGTIMVTYRKYDMVQEDFLEAVSYLKKHLNSEGFEVEKEIVEFSIYDTNQVHDSTWLTE